jgi:ABC-2 type transport system permease protein
MFRAIAKFELQYQLKAPLFYILFIVYFLLTFGAVTSDAVTIGGAVGAVNRNAPFVIMQFMLVMSFFGVLTTTAFVANSIHRDFELGTDALFFSSPISKAQYLGGRFAGSFIVSMLVFFGVASAIMIGSLMPWIEKERLGPFELWPYIFSTFVLILPNLLLCGAIFFAVAALTRSLMATYASVVGFFVAFGIAESLLSDIENETVSALLDPFAGSSFAVATRYWTVFDKNTRLLPIEGIFLWNRLLWVGVALLVLGFAYWRFQFTTGSRKTRKKAKRAAAAELTVAQPSLTLPRVTQSFGGVSSWRQYLASTRREAISVFKSIPFVIMLLLGMAMIWGNADGNTAASGTNFYPVTHRMVEAIFGGFSIFALLIAAFYAGDIVWRERTIKINEVHDTMPAPTWVLWASKFTALIFVVYTALFVAVLTAMVIQASKGYTNFEPSVYFKGVFLQIGVWITLIAVLSYLMQVYFNNKFVGFLGVLVWFVVMRVLPALDFEHRLYRIAAIPIAQYSDMNGFGHFAWPLAVYSAYWLLFMAALMVLAHLLWVRGTGGGLRQRLAIARQRLNGKVVSIAALCLIGFAATGCYIFYNTNVLNEYETTKDGERRQAAFEKSYKKFQNVPQPRITDVQANVAIYPERREVAIDGRYRLVNRTKAPIAELHILGDPTLTTFSINIPGAKLKSNDEDNGFAVYTLAPPLAPGATMEMTFRTGWKAEGFVQGQSRVTVVENGTFFDNFAFFPHLGYVEGFELQDRNKRRKYGLPPIERMKPPSDVAARMNNQISRESDWINLDTTVSTSSDQIALAPGYLQRQWTENGRRHFHYKTTSPILGFWSYLSARYEVKKDTWTSPEGKKIPIEIYYDAKHAYNVDRMIDSVKKSLSYFTANFSPYQHEQVRILEFPGYRTFAQAFPNTIPFSESIGFIADLRDEEAIDYVFYVTSHEIAHQWWAHQVIGGNVQGSTMIVETMAQYSALMVMEKEYGREKMQKFLRYELDRYLRDRGSELIAEMPLSLVENQGYIHYRKGSLVMYALRDAIGEERVNAALRKFLAAHAFSGPPYTTGGELVKFFRAEAPPEAQELITDLFERITLFDNQARTATMQKRADGKYVVKLTVTSSKLRGDDKGEEKTVALNDLIDIGVLGEKDKILFLEKRRLTKPTETFEMIVNEKPVKAGIDPLNKLIDRNPKDNVKSVTE